MHWEHTQSSVACWSACAIVETSGDALGVNESRRLEIYLLDLREVLGSFFTVFRKGNLIIVVPNCGGQAGAQKPSESSAKRHFSSGPTNSNNKEETLGVDHAGISSFKPLQTTFLVRDDHHTLGA